MPTYEYRCPDGHEFERFYKTISAAQGEVQCPECGATATRKLSAGAGLLFKGSGFYLTDYGKNAHRGAAPKSEGGKAEGAKSDAPKSDSTKDSSPRSEAPKAEGPKPKAETPKADKPKTSKPKSE